MVVVRIIPQAPLPIKEGALLMPEMKMPPEFSTLMGRPIAFLTGHPEDGAPFFDAKPREIGNAITRLPYSEVPYAPQDLAERAKRNFDQVTTKLKANCKRLVITEPEIINAPITDRIARYQTVGWRSVWASPEADFFEKMFECKRRHHPGYIDKAYAKEVLTDYLRNTLYPKWKVQKVIKRLAGLVRDFDEWDH